MRKIHLLLMLCLPLCTVMPAKAQPKGMLPAEKAEIKAGEMKESLDLTDKQYKKLCRLFRKTEKALLKARSTAWAPVMGGPGGMMPPGMRPGNDGNFRGGPGMPPGHGMPPREGMMPPEAPQKEGGDEVKPDSGENPGTAEGRKGPGMPEQPSEKEMKIISKETGKIKKILSEEQFIKWRESLHESRKK